MTATIIHGNNLDILPTFDDCSIDAIVTDPPYELGFMGKRWDASGIAYNVTLWQECLRVLKPGGHLLAFGGTRTYHRMGCAIEDAGFEIRDSIHWLYGSGFPKSLDVSKAIDKMAGAEREVLETQHRQGRSAGILGTPVDIVRDVTAPATDAAKQWAGWGTALKPAHEPIVVARKPLIGTVAANVLEFGTGAINIDATRIAGAPWTPVAPNAGGRSGGVMGKHTEHPGGEPHSAGRWPANVILTHTEDCTDECVPGCPVAELDQQSGKVGNNWKTNYGQKYAEEERQYGGGSFGGGGYRNAATYADTGGASRFFYCAKPSRRERNAGLDHLDEKPGGVKNDSGRGYSESDPHKEIWYQNHHPTVKPLALMRYLARLVTPPNGTVLDPFAGSGTTLMACVLENFNAIGIEMTDEYLPIIQGRIAWAEQQAANTPDQQELDL